MSKLIANSKLDLDLIQEALHRHGFKTTSTIERKWRWFGKRYYVVEVDFIPGEEFLKKLLDVALSTEDYWTADSIQRMINIRKNASIN